jgi:hypothetical protein
MVRPRNHSSMFSASPDIQAEFPSIGIKRSFLGPQLNPKIFRTKWKEATVVGLVGFVGPFLGWTAIAHYVLDWTGRSSWLGRSCPQPLVAVLYAVMLERFSSTNRSSHKHIYRNKQCACNYGGG